MKPWGGEKNGDGPDPGKEKKKRGVGNTKRTHGPAGARNSGKKKRGNELLAFRGKEGRGVTPFPCEKKGSKKSEPRKKKNSRWAFEDMTRWIQARKGEKCEKKFSL